MTVSRVPDSEHLGKIIFYRTIFTIQVFVRLLHDRWGSLHVFCTTFTLYDRFSVILRPLYGLNTIFDRSLHDLSDDLRESV